jgi:hypothetical protein
MTLRIRPYGYCANVVSFMLLLGTFYGFSFAAIYPTWRRFECLAHRGIETHGRVTANEPDNHSGVRYEYQVAGVSYTGISPAGHGGLAPLNEVNLGDSIPVVYLAESPSVSVAGDPNAPYQSWSGLLFLVLPFGIVLLLGIAALRKRL